MFIYMYIVHTCMVVIDKYDGRMTPGLTCNYFKNLSFRGIDKSSFDSARKIIFVVFYCNNAWSD